MSRNWRKGSPLVGESLYDTLPTHDLIRDWYGPRGKLATMSTVEIIVGQLYIQASKPDYDILIAYPTESGEPEGSLAP